MSVIDFPGPLSRVEAQASSFESGVVCSIDSEEGTKLTTFGRPSASDLLWLSEQLRLLALYESEAECDTQIT